MCEILLDLIFSCCLCFCNSEDYEHYEPFDFASYPPDYGSSDTAPPPLSPNYPDNASNYPPNYSDNATSNYPPNYSDDNAQNYPPNW